MPDREGCPDCIKAGRDISQDNLRIFKDNKHCYACGYHESKTANKNTPLLQGIFVELAERKLSLSSCEKYNIRIAIYKGRNVAILPYYLDGFVVKQKIRDRNDKQFMPQFGETKNQCLLFGQQAFSPNKKYPIIITEGEFDAVAIYQMSNYAAISIPDGAQSAVNSIMQQYDWLLKWREIYLCFDMDVAGRKAVKECSSKFIFKDIKLPVKDANELLIENKGFDFIKYFNEAEVLKPNTLIFPDEIKEKTLIPPVFGKNWPWKFMTKVTYGLRPGEVYILAGDTGLGKTEIVYEILGNQLKEGNKVGLFDLERQPEQTLLRLVSKFLNIKAYLPGKNFDSKLIGQEIDRLKRDISLFQPSSGILTVDEILTNIRFLTKAYDYNFFIIDNLTYLSSSINYQIKEHEFAAHAVGKFVQLSKELNVTIFIISHIVKDSIQLTADITLGESYIYNANKEGLTWETGRMPEIKHITGGGKVAKLPDYIILCARNRMSTDLIEKRTIRLKFVKTRFESTFEGEEFKLMYDLANGRLME